MYKDAVFLTMGGILIPLGFYIKIEHAQDDAWGTWAVIIGLACWLLAYFLVNRKEKKEKLEKIEAKKQEQIERQKETDKISELLVGIRDELKELNDNTGKRGKK